MQFDGCFVRSSGWFENEESLFICMEYFALGDLQKYICQPFPEGEAQHITLQILEGLDFMHSNGFDHRDLKPQVRPLTRAILYLGLIPRQNIFIIAKSPEWWVKIGDFGISKRVMEGLTGLQTFNSAPAFTAPELYKTMWEPNSSKEAPTSNFNPEVDIWSVGVISYYLLTGKLPFDGQHDLLAYYSKESELPTGSLTGCQSSDEALKFLKDILIPSPSDRLSARDALEHSWLASLLQESDPDEPVEPPIQPPMDEKIIPPLQPRRPRSSQDVMLPGTINLTGTQMMLGPGTPLTLPPHNQPSYANSLVEATQQELISQQQYHLQLQQQQVMMAKSQTSDEQQSNIGTFGVNGDYKPPVSYTADRISGLNLLSNVHPLHRPAADPGTPYSESQITNSSPSPRPAPLRQLSSQFTPSDMSTETRIDTLPRYTRRRSDAAPIPISDLDPDPNLPPRTETPTPSASESRSRSSTIESPRGSIERQNSERRFSDRFRRVSGSMLPKRHNQRSVDHGKKKDKDKDKDSLRESDGLSGSSTAYGILPFLSSWPSMP